MMRRVSVVASLLAAVFSAAGASRAADVMDKAAFERTLAQIQAAAQESATFLDPNDPLLASLLGVAYGPESLEPLRAALGALPTTETGVFTAARLLTPLISSEEEIVRKAVPGVLGAWGRLAKYQPLHAFSKAELAALDLPDKPDPRASAETNLKRLSEYAAMRRKRLEADGKVLRHNTQATILEKTICRVLLKAGRAAEDDKVLEGVARAEQERKSTYKFGLEAIAAEASRMDPARAARLYASLEKTGRSMENAESNYLDPVAVRIGTSANSYFVCPRCFPGVDMLRAANALAPVVGKPALTVPEYADVAAGNLLNAAKAHIARKQNPQAERSLRELLRYYPNSKVAEEARRLLSTVSRS